VNEYGSQLRAFDEEHEIAPGVIVRRTGGHTPGHGVVRLASGGDALTFAGDAVFAVGFDQPDWHNGFEHDPEVAARVRIRYLRITIGHPYTIHIDAVWMEQMPSNVHELRPKPPETEKITINLGYVDLGHVDLMVQDGFYSNRSDFIRTAIRNQLERHADVVKQSTARKGLDLGLRSYTRADLEAALQAGEMLHINVLGLASIAQDVTADLARATIASVSVLGALHATPAVKAALADRTR
jgi:Arc/MetJ-type ribon-helix-helix transcriptional regulator